MIGQKRAPEELAVIALLLGWAELESESSRLFAQAYFGSPLCLFIATVEDALCVGFLRR